MYHVSDFKKFERCPRMFLLSRTEKKPFTPFINYNMSMMELCKELLMIQDPFVGEANDDPERAMEALNTHTWLLNARFAYEDLRVKIPILYREEEKTVVYFLSTTCYPKESEAQKIADTLAVLELIDIFVDEVYVIHLNALYVREQDLQVRDLLIINDHLYNGKNKPVKNLMNLIEKCKRDVTILLEELRACVALETLPSPCRSNACTRGIKCPYYEDCFPQTLHDTSILHLVQSASKYEMEEEGIHDMKDVDIDRIEGTRHQYAQIMAAKYGRYVDQAALRCWIKDHITYPISYLDFEWETYAYPPYDGMKPFDVLCFQYSLHVEDAKGNVTHDGFIGVKDCRIDFIESLIEKIPSTGCILVYNMEGAEKLRLVQLAQQFPQYHQALEQIWTRMVDLSLPFSTGNVYDNRMAGFFSLKTLVPIFSDYNYKDLDISFGMDAVESYRQMLVSDEKTQEKIKQQLDAYCSMDTYAEYIIYHALEKLAFE